MDTWDKRIEEQRRTAEQLLKENNMLKPTAPIKVPRIVSTGESVTAHLSERLPNAEDLFSQLREQINLFQKRLDDKHDLAIQLGGLAAYLRVAEFGCKSDLFIFNGTMDTGEEATLCQTISQLNVLLIAVERAEIETPKTPIGFFFEPTSGESPSEA